MRCARPVQRICDPCTAGRSETYIMYSVVELSSDRVAPTRLVNCWGSTRNASGRGMPMGTGLAGLQARLRWWWGGVPEPVRLAALAGLAAIAILALLTAFFIEVREAGLQGGMRRDATAALAAMTWRCNAVQDANARQDCLLRLPPAPNRGAMQSAQTDTSVVDITLLSEARKAP